MRTITALAFALWAQIAGAANIYVMSLTPSSVQIIVDGRALRTLRPGEVSPEGVKLTEIRGSAAVFEVGGRAVALSLGQSTLAETLLRADARGQFLTTAYLNGVGLPAMIDTGATLVSLNAEHARQLGIDFRTAQRSATHTANGLVPVYLVTLARVQVGEVVLANIPALVHEGGRERLPIVLIGMSFLKQVEMRRSGDTMSLSRPHLQ
jgi:aspartyl protease family protein